MKIKWILHLLSQDMPVGEKLRLIMLELFSSTFAKVPMEWSYPLFANWFRLKSTVHIVGYAILFAFALAFLLYIRRRKNFLLWCPLYAALIVDILLCAATNHYFALRVIMDGGQGSCDVAASIAAFAFIGLLIAAIACHIFVKKTK